MLFGGTSAYVSAHRSDFLLRAAAAAWVQHACVVQMDEADVVIWRAEGKKEITPLQSHGLPWQSCRELKRIHPLDWVKAALKITA